MKYDTIRYVLIQHRSITERSTEGRTESRVAFMMNEGGRAIKIKET